MSYQFIRTNIHDTHFLEMVKMLDAELRDMYGDQQDDFDPHNKLKEDTFVLVVKTNDQTIGCGAFRPMEDGVAEIKRMFVHPDHRGKGLSKLILSELETWIKEKQYSYIKLETGNKNIAALSLYPASGYEPIEPFGPYKSLPGSFCFGKKIKF